MRVRSLVGALFCVLGWVGCGGGSSSPGDRLVGDWLFTNADQTGGVFLDISADGTYADGPMVITSASATSGTANVEVEDGVWTATDTEITMRPTKWSCPGPDSVSTLRYSYLGANLALTTPNGVITFAPNNGPPTSQTIVLTTGCFAQDGTFTPAPVSPVSN
jgi:hypothetical protein